MHKFNPKNISIFILILAILIGLGYSTIRFGLSKENISFPKKDHAHFRLKYVFNGQEENFGSPRYQTDYTKDICNGTLTESPLHFHDNKTDYQHMHWARQTGGQMLKFYGLNYIGGLDNYMGFKIDKFAEVIPVPIHSNSLPKPRLADKFWIYTGVEQADKWNVQTKTFDEFINQDFETFFSKESQVRKDEEKYGITYLDLVAPIVAQAHAGEEHKTLDEAQKHLLEVGEKAQVENLNNQVVANVTTSSVNFISSQQSSQSNTSTKPEFDPVTGEELKAINNFLGDVVIFVQPDAPTDEQIQARFKSMIKLDKSSCGG